MLTFLAGHVQGRGGLGLVKLECHENGALCLMMASTEVALYRSQCTRSSILQRYLIWLPNTYNINIIPDRVLLLVTGYGNNEDAKPRHKRCQSLIRH